MSDQLPKDALEQVAGNCVCRRARMAARRITRHYDAALRPAGLKITQFTLMVAIAKGPPATMSALADALAMERTTLVRNLQLLEKEGLVALGPEGTHRVREIALTNEGHKRLVVAYPCWEEAQARIQDQMAGEDWDSIQSTLKTLSTIG